MKYSALVLAALAVSTIAPAADFELKEGDHVCIVGNLLAERMQHDGWLETIIQRRFPERQIRFRNLGFSGDELDHRSRSSGFGSPDSWLARCQADVVIAMFGYNESFADKAGIPAFKTRLENFIKHTRGQKYNGKSAPRLVLISPSAFQNLRNRNLPDGADHNRRLSLYTDAMRQVADAHKVPFVDLFAATQQAFKQPGRWTLNGHYLTKAGNQLVADVIDRSLFGKVPASALQGSQLEQLRKSVVDKNFYWFHRYRTTDGFNIYGGRSHMRYNGQTNRVVMMREMAMLDAKTANRDKRVWALANGRDIEVDDRTVPESIPVRTNFPGPHKFLSGEDAIRKMKLGKGMRVNLFASDEQFPQLINPVQMAFDTKGRLFVAVWPSYPHWHPKDPMNDKILIFTDTNGDGKADTVKTFADKLNNPTGFEFWGGGMLVAMAPDLLFLKDTDGDDVADVRIRVLHGIDSADTHHTANSFAIDPGGALYFQEGTFHMSQIETLAGSQRNQNGCVWRFDPRTWRVDRYIPYNFANPHGHVFTRWGQDIVHDGTGAVPYHAALFSGHLDFPDKQPGTPVLYNRRTRPCPATEILSSRHFPKSFQGNLLVANVIGLQGILRYNIKENQSSFTGIEQATMLTSSDRNFRPTDMEIGPDGALYLVDWQNPIIGHLQHHIRDPNRDKTHGRIYRITYQGRKLLKPPKIAGAAIADLLELLKSPEDRVRFLTRIELSGRDSKAVISAAKKWIANLDTSHAAFEHHRLEGLWLHQQHNQVNEKLLRSVLKSPDHRARAAATRVLCYWADQLPGSLDLVKTMAADPHSHVRLQAVRAASFYKVAEAMEVPLISTRFKSDRYINHVRNTTMWTLKKHWDKAMESGRPLKLTSDEARRYLVQQIPTPRLLGMKRSRGVYLELLFRTGIRDEFRREAIQGLARDEKKPPLIVLLDAISQMDSAQQKQSVVVDLVRLLTQHPASELSQVRSTLQRMALHGKQDVVRQVGFVALIAADRSIEPSYKLAQANESAMKDFLAAMPLIVDPNIRAVLYPRVVKLAKTIKKPAKGRRAGEARFVRIELPGNNRVLTLAEVQVMSDKKNVARRGKARQSSTGYGGAASRGIDGNTSGSYGGNGQTHTNSQANPFWEVDLGRTLPVDSVVVFNRTDGNLGNRLNGFTLKVLDARRRVLFERKSIPAPKRSISIPVGLGDPGAIIRARAMLALTYVRGKEAETFDLIGGKIYNNQDRAAGIRFIQRIPRRYWPADKVAKLAPVIVATISKIPAKDRNSPEALEALRLGDALASVLPADQARALRRQLGQLGVRVIRIGTLPHRMSYDVVRVAVQAGKAVQFSFENADLMPHNLVITRPGSLADVGQLAEKTARDADAIARQYVPRSPHILLASSLIGSGQSQQLNFVAPAKPGVYPIVCTYPGHWRRMYAALYVVADLDAYQANPQAYLAKSSLPIRDELLKYNRPRKEWTMDELAGPVTKMMHGRSFDNARRMFQVASCSACHKLNKVGNEFGPDLAKLDAKKKPRDILESLLFPSKTIEKKFQTYQFALKSGKIVTGMILKEADGQVELIENPLAKAKPLVIKASDIKVRRKSAVSIMPKGLLEKLTREEILDLLAYVIARGKRDHALFKGEHKH